MSIGSTSDLGARRAGPRNRQRLAAAVGVSSPPVRRAPADAVQVSVRAGQEVRLWFPGWDLFVGAPGQAVSVIGGTAGRGTQVLVDLDAVARFEIVLVSGESDRDLRKGDVIRLRRVGGPSAGDELCLSRESWDHAVHSAPYQKQQHDAFAWRIAAAPRGAVDGSVVLESVADPRWSLAPYKGLLEVTSNEADRSAIRFRAD
ncbi:hypothetical protein [Pelagovum pacificum]|uniref:Uncharacterized protein n=1 Tax=Pelagovum pacificum TaxID=2588711 RepID=A0A5C5GDM6_9RHOB|nr:hypothetical protein [Pelagovum pacificum]QQA44614.1 hypothetical protein I8N54_08615 [Pelagovum pacificum]TNY32274.1 hypothetical protein FHY64_02975 [Pelagovum pacificum]